MTKDATLGYLQDVARGQSETTDAVREVERAVRENPAPMMRTDVVPIVINVPAPVIEQRAADAQVPPIVNVTVPVPVVNVAAPDVTVDVAAPAPVAYRVTVTDRDDSGLIRSFVIAPIV